MKRLFLASICCTIFLFSCSTTISDSEIIARAYSLSSQEAQELYLSYGENSPRILYNLAYSYLESGDIEKAIESARDGEELYPDYLRFYKLEAYCHRELDDIDNYIDCLERIIKIDPANVEIMEMLLDIYVDKEVEQEVITTAKAILLVDSDNENALNALSLYIPFYQELTGYTPIKKAVESAIENIEKYLTLTPKLQKL